MPRCAWKHRNGANWRNASSEIGTIATARAATTPYIGRFAPSPTGPLHFGSLLAAVASYLEARGQHGQWLVRVEDIDPPREDPGATDLILRALEVYGFEWDGRPAFQSANNDAHFDALQRLVATGHTYPCGCSRKDLADARRGPLGIIYPGICRAGCDASETAIRLRTTDEPIEFMDRLQGLVTQRLESESGDFIIRRRDGLIAYHLAVVVDDHLHSVTDIVRGIDLMDSTPRQIWLQRLLDIPQPGYAHIPVAVNALGQKLSKSHGAGAVPLASPAPTLIAALEALALQPPPGLASASVGEIWSWARQHWRIDRLQGRREIPVGHLRAEILQRPVS